MTLGDPLAAAASWSGLLRALGIPHAVGGSVASSLHGVPRSTADVDFVAWIGVADVRRLIDSAGAEFEIDEDHVRQCLRSGQHFNVFHDATAMKIDVFPATGRFARAELTRAIDVEVDARLIRAVCAEDVLVHKLWWYREGGEASERQWRDVLGIIGVQGARLDHALLAESAAELGVEDLLAKALVEPGGGL